MDDSVIRAEIAALEHVSYFEKSVNIDYTDMAKLLQGMFLILIIGKRNIFTL